MGTFRRRIIAGASEGSRTSRPTKTKWWDGPRSVVLEVFTSATGGLALTQTEVALVPCRFADAPLLDAAAIWLIGAQRPDATFGCS